MSKIVYLKKNIKNKENFIEERNNIMDFLLNMIEGYLKKSSKNYIITANINSHLTIICFLISLLNGKIQQIDSISKVY